MFLVGFIAKEEVKVLLLPSVLSAHYDTLELLSQ